MLACARFGWQDELVMLSSKLEQRTLGGSRTAGRSRIHMYVVGPRAHQNLPQLGVLGTHG